MPAASGLDLDADRIAEGQTAVVSVTLDRPGFLGSVRGLLGRADVGSGVAQAVREHLGTWLKTHPEQGGAVVDRVLRRAGT
ncbi:hypothetical protein [Streptomyces sp. 11x1]|uniref:hypothetical protein n=1 Tax=Streptomyces sp. 11x1 TaxID=3038642 RepID=UPI00292E805B|nr:hypothetical protein [Streptomyces sp. 11x1]WNZ06792.1 hypothetical protein P8T65_03730 [Streptomyces sp. 11x1]